jgi:2-polyprenyl-3-methyl-5-hydroxy-6-metoxy-1,4-benzoquinol methylase
LNFVGSRRTVLDIGCGRGAFAAELSRNGNIVTGIDQHAGAAEGGLVQSFRADLDEPLEPVFQELQGRTFDRVLLLDVLEHLRSPERLLNICHSVLNPGAQLIVSVPNIANITTRFGLMFGQFTYADRGILDRTHLRFFTCATVRRTIEAAGYEIVETQMTNMPIERIIGFVSPAHPFMKALDRVLRVATRCLPRLLGYQIMIVARSKSAASLKSSIGRAS